MTHFARPLALVFALCVLGGCGGGGSDDDDDVERKVTPREVGAAFKNPGDDRIVLVSTTGDRAVYFDRDQGTFSPAMSVQDMFPNLSVTTIGSATEIGELMDQETLFADLTGATSVRYAADTSSTDAPVSWDELGATSAPFASVGAMFAAGTNLFVFNPGGSEYAAFSLSTASWSPTYSFLGDFGGGGTPIGSVGAAFFTGSTEYVLFDLSGTRWTTYQGGGVFTAAFSLDELGDGTLSFN